MPTLTGVPGRVRQLASTDDADLRRYGAWTGGAAAVATGLWLWLQLDLLDGRVFGNFYDIQARSLLDGHLAVPAGSLGGEAFAVRGQEFLYNPPGPSILRMPLFLVTDRFDGRLTVLSMLAAYVVTVVLLALLVWRVRCLLAPGAELGRPEAFALGAFLVTGAAGSTLLYLGSVPWVFHEAYAWAIAMTLGSAYALIGVLQAPSLRGVLATGAFTLGAVLSRATAGFACAAAVMLAGAWLLRGGRGREARDWWWAVGLAGAMPVLISAGVNWAKFRHPWLFPIEDQVFAGLSQRRREAMRANGGDLFGFDVLWSTVPAYLRPDGIRFSSLYPFVSLPADPAPAYHGGVLDMSYRTGSVVALMPLLVALSVLGVVRTLQRGADAAVKVLRLPLLGVALIPGGVLFAAYISHRYTSEFVPFLLVGGAIGVVDLGRRLLVSSDDTRRIVLGAVGLLAAFGVGANLAVAISTQALANPGTVLADHLDRQEQFSFLGGGLDGHVVASLELPTSAPPDEVRIIGECQAVYVGTGEEFTPWTEAGNRPLTFRFTRTGSVPPDATGELALAEFAGHRRNTLVLERKGDEYRTALRGGGLSEEGSWFRPAAGSTFDVVVRTDRIDDYLVEVAGDGITEATADDELRVAKENHDEDWYWLPNILSAVAPTPQALAAEGVLVEVVAADAPAGCEERLTRYREAELP